MLQFVFLLVQLLLSLVSTCLMLFSCSNFSFSLFLGWFCFDHWWDKGESPSQAWVMCCGCLSRWFVWLGCPPHCHFDCSDSLPPPIFVISRFDKCVSSSPSCRLTKMTRRVCFICFLSSYCRIWPTYLRRHARIQARMLKVVVALVVSSRFVLSVMCESIYAFMSFIQLYTASVSNQPSESYTSMFLCIHPPAGSATTHMFRKVPTRGFARVHLYLKLVCVSLKDWAEVGELQTVVHIFACHPTWLLTARLNSFRLFFLVSLCSVRWVWFLLHLCFLRRMCVCTYR